MSEKKSSKHIYVSEETHKRAKLLAAKMDMSVKDAMYVAIKAALLTIEMGHDNNS